MEEANFPSPKNGTLWFGIALEGALVFCAVGLSFIGLYDPQQRLAGLGWNQTRIGLFWGTIASLPLLGYLVAFHYFPSRWMGSLRRFCRDQLQPMFQGSEIWELALLSLAAGIGEELLFRWCLQGGFTEIFEARFEQPIAELTALFLASLLFGLCHAVTKLYFVVTLIGGLFLGWTMIATGNWLVPAVAHAIYDFVALVYIAKIMNSEDPGKPSHEILL